MSDGVSDLTGIVSELRLRAQPADGSETPDDMRATAQKLRDKATELESLATTMDTQMALYATAADKLEAAI